MRVLQVNVVYKSGSTGKIVYDIHKQLIKNKYQSIVCYGRGKNVIEPNIYKTAPEFVMKLQSLRSRVTGYAYSGCVISTKRLIKIIQSEKPNVVHLHCLNGYFVNIYKLMEFLKKSSIKTVLTLHAEFMYTAGCGHAYDCERWKTGCYKCPQLKEGRPHSWFFDKTSKEWEMMRVAFNGYDDIVICPVSEWLKNRAIQSPFIRDKRVVTVTNGVNTDIFKATDFAYLKKKHNLGDEKVILHVTPNFLSEHKGGNHVLELANRFIDNKVKFIIVGFNGNVATLRSNVIAVAHVSDPKELAAYYSMADVSLLTSKKETFSMICAESLCCGTPIVGFEAGAPETISIKAYSEFVEQGNIDKLECILRKWLDRKEQFNWKIDIDAKKKYSKETMCSKYFEIYKG